MDPYIQAFCRIRLRPFRPQLSGWLPPARLLQAMTAHSMKVFLRAWCKALSRRYRPDFNHRGHCVMVTSRMVSCEYRSSFSCPIHTFAFHCFVLPSSTLLLFKHLTLPNLIPPFCPNRLVAIVAILRTFYGTLFDSTGAHYRPACAKYFIVLLCCLVAAGVGDAFLVVFFGHGATLLVTADPTLCRPKACTACMVLRRRRALPQIHRFPICRCRKFSDKMIHRVRNSFSLQWFP